MSFRRIEYFLSVAKHLNFTKAARECFVAQAAISQQIKQFEQELGFSLFDRGGASVKLTPAGEYFAHQCQTVMDQYNRAVKGARAIVDQSKNVLRVGFRGPFTPAIFTGTLRKYQAENPDVTVSVQEDTEKNLLDRLRSSELDLVILPDTGGDWDEFQTLDLQKGPSWFMAAADSSLAGSRLIFPDQLADQSLIRVEGTSMATADHIQPDYYYKLGLKKNPTQWVSSFFQALVLVQVGLGISSLPPGGEDALPAGVTAFQIQGDRLELRVAALRANPSTSVTADSFFRLLRRELERTTP